MKKYPFWNPNNNTHTIELKNYNINYINPKEINHKNWIGLIKRLNIEKKLLLLQEDINNIEDLGFNKNEPEKNL